MPVSSKRKKWPLWEVVMQVYALMIPHAPMTGEEGKFLDRYGIELDRVMRLVKLNMPWSMPPGEVVIRLKRGVHPPWTTGTIRRRFAELKPVASTAERVPSPAKGTVIRSLAILCHLGLVRQEWRGTRPIYRFVRLVQFGDLALGLRAKPVSL